jgi:hypothetical protein
VLSFVWETGVSCTVPPNEVSVYMLDGRVLYLFRTDRDLNSTQVTGTVSPRMDGYRFDEEFANPHFGFGWETRTVHRRNGTAIRLRKLMLRLDVFLMIGVALELFRWSMRGRPREDGQGAA